MSKSKIRIALSVLISLGVIFAIYTTVLGAPFNFFSEKVGAHPVSGAMTNFNHDRLTVSEREAYQAELDALYNSTTKDGRGCESESFNSPID